MFPECPQTAGIRPGGLCVNEEPLCRWRSRLWILDSSRSCSGMLSANYRELFFQNSESRSMRSKVHLKQNTASLFCAKGQIQRARTDQHGAAKGQGLKDLEFQARNKTKFHQTFNDHIVARKIFDSE